MLLSVLTAVYVISALLLTLFSVNALILLFTYLRYRRVKLSAAEVTEWPPVAVQLPIFNEKYVVDRLIESVANLDYPADKLLIQVLDDSTDETKDQIAARVAEYRARGLRIEHIWRADRRGFKAGALANGLDRLPEDIAYVAVFDADFTPQPDFLKRTIPHLVHNPHVGMVQTRWGHLNSTDNLVTRGQSLAMDAHFVIEQTARNRAGFLMNFNGTGGVWRVQAIRDSGGWRDITLTEDLDLSYRAQLKGWQFVYLPDVVVPGELPPQIAAYRQQQARWAKGNTQCLVLLAPSVWKARRLRLSQRLMATLHLGQYVVHPLIIIMLLLTPPMLLSQNVELAPLAPLGLAGLGPPLLFVIGQQQLYRDWKRRVLAFPALLAFGTGLAWSNTRAVIGALIGRKEEFKRTPKYARKVQGNIYALRMGSPQIFWETALCLYAVWGLFVALRYAPSLVIYMAIYILAFGAVAVWGLRDYFLLRRSAAQAA